MREEAKLIMMPSSYRYSSPEVSASSLWAALRIPKWFEGALENIDVNLRRSRELEDRRVANNLQPDSEEEVLEAFSYILNQS